MTTKTDTEQLRADFEAWWKKEGQYCRAGGGDYEKTFAYRAYQSGRADLQSQDREDVERLNFIEANPGWLRVSRLGHRTKQMWACASPFTDYEHDFFKTAREAIDHARRIEGGGE